MKNKKIQLLEKPTTVLNYYKEPSFLIPIGITCSWKCENCINKKHVFEYSYPEFTINEIISQYQKNILTYTIIMAGFEPFDNYVNFMDLVEAIRVSGINDMIVVYTGYDIVDFRSNFLLLNIFQELTHFDNIIIKFGRYIEGLEKVWNEELGIWLASANQYTVRITK